MLPLAALPLLFAPTFVSVGNIGFRDLWDLSPLVVLARVRKVRKILRDLPPEWVPDPDRPQGPDGDGASFAELEILETWRGPSEVRSMLVPTDRTFLCDVTDAVEGETAIFFLESCRIFATEGTGFRARLDEAFGEHEVMKITFWGRGRMALVDERGSECVRVPPGVEDLPESFRDAFGGKIATYDDVRRILETYRQLELQPWLTARSTPGASGGFGWNLAVAADGSCRLITKVVDKFPDRVTTRKHEVERILAVDPDALRTLRESIEAESAWSLPPLLGTLRPAPDQREVHFVRTAVDADGKESSSETSVTLSAIDCAWLGEPGRRESTARALEVWAKIRELFDDGACADSREDDQRLLAEVR